jgi:heme ABC exporter ATP-binding subunit CcmA
MSDYAVDVHNLRKSFGPRRVVDGLTLQVAAGEICGFLGANGSGKTTTIRMLCGLLPPTAGTATVAGAEVTTETEKVKNAIGYMSQAFGLYGDLTVEENLRFYGGVYGLGSELKQRIAWAMQRMMLAELGDRLSGRLSGGQRQRLALGCALLHHPRVLFLDEPTAGVDPAARRLFWSIIRGLAEEGTTIIVTTHYMDEAERFDRLVFMSRGKVTAVGTPDEVKRTFGEGMSLEDIFVHLQETDA